MAYSDAISTLFRRRFERELEIPFIWRGYVGDESAFFASGGTTLDYRLDATDATVSATTNEDSSTASDHARGTPVLVEPTKATFTLDKFHFIDEVIPVHMIEQIQAPMVNSRAQKAARAVANTLNTGIRTELNASTNATLLLTAIAVASGDWGNANHQAALMGAAEDARDEIDLAGQGAQLAWITSVANRRVVRDYLKAQKFPFVEGIFEDALVRSRVIRWEGFDIIADPSAGSGTTNTDDAKHTNFFIGPGEQSPVRFAARTPAPRVFESEVYRGTRITDEFSYGADVIFPEYGRLAKTAIS